MRAASRIFGIRHSTLGRIVRPEVFSQSLADEDVDDGTVRAYADSDYIAARPGPPPRRWPESRDIDYVAEPVVVQDDSGRLVHHGPSGALMLGHAPLRGPTDHLRGLDGIPDPHT